jgi:hypothetical protein
MQKSTVPEVCSQKALMGVSATWDNFKACWEMWHGTTQCTTARHCGMAPHSAQCKALWHGTTQCPTARHCGMAPHSAQCKTLWHGTTKCPAARHCGMTPHSAQHQGTVFTLMWIDEADTAVLQVTLMLAAVVRLVTTSAPPVCWLAASYSSLLTCTGGT